MYYGGWYHFFYQYDPLNATWANIVWGHSVSQDLINWVELDPAIKPSILGDQHGCWSGSSTILLDGTPAIMYTGIIQEVEGNQYEVQNLAYPRNTSDPLLREWVKPEYNPVIIPDASINATKFRDPTTTLVCRRAGPKAWPTCTGAATSGGGQR
jgi:beta-fructofuranosidase